jgi:hypothetical protein
MVSPPWRRQKPLGVEWQQRVQPNHGFDSAQSQSLDSDGEIHTLVCVFNGSATESFESVPRPASSFDVEGPRYPGQHRYGFGSQLSRDVAAMHLHGDFADRQFVRDLLVH